ncbi:type II toxin-antitoxin system HigB family toxin [Arcticibacter svalbardensis]|uniref:type II toxin-antitoxin system HigB family toxin n=1 Tax=Arcticibacter svalbardensis TaxID=1288027 RepID=UPI001F2AA1E9|nr:type II toxin-antitoxin system HigB family toxin [Arcticibacter svalbardensis]
MKRYLLNLDMINIVKRPTINHYQKKYPESATALSEWYDHFSRCSFQTPQELKIVYGNASIIGNNRVVFNIHGNKYRLVIKFNYKASMCFVIWFGTHKEYDSIDVETIRFEL